MLKHTSCISQGIFYHFLNQIFFPAKACTPISIAVFAKSFTYPKGFQLPVTGGIGTLIFSVLGIVFMGVAISLVRSIFKNKKVENI